MSVKKFKFVSPGVFINEIDNSFIPREEGPLGPLIIGRSERGPALRPVRVNSFSEFIDNFGYPIPGGKGDDVAREGNYVGPTYGPFAAQAYLRSAVGPCTFVRLLGVQHTDATTAGKAGWSTDSTYNTTTDNGGAYGLFIFPSESIHGVGVQGKVSAVTGTLAAVWYMTKGYSVELSGTWRGSDSVAVTGAACLVKSVDDGGSYQSFRTVIKSVTEQTDPTEVTLFNFNDNSEKYIRKRFNTNPQLTNTTITNTDNQKVYWLGETFDRRVRELGITGSSYGCILAIQTTASTPLGPMSQKRDYANAKTGWFIGQDLTTNTGSFDAAGAQKLFRLLSREHGEWHHKKLKVSIERIKKSTTKNSQYGSFSVVLRHIADTDNAIQVIERFDNCNLDPTSPNYIARKIGNQYTTWDSQERRLRLYGDYPNMSKFIRVDMDADTDNGSTDPAIIPFGYFGPPKYKDWAVLSGTMPLVNSGQDQVLTADTSDPMVAGTSSIANALHLNSTAKTGPNQTQGAPGNPGLIACGPVAWSASISYGYVPLRKSGSDGGLDPRSAYFGIQTTRTPDSTVYDASVPDFHGPNIVPAGMSETSNQIEYSYYFTMDDISGSGVNDGCWVSGSRVAGNSLTAVSGTYEGPLKRGFRQFTAPFYGGFDGLDITEREPFRNSGMGTDSTQFNNYAYNSIKRAIDTVADPEFVEYNLATIPGLTKSELTTHLIRTCEDRADALAVVDIENVYTAETEGTESAANRRGTVASAVTSLRDRQVDSSYGCTFYPWLQIRDERTGRVLWSPPSVAMLGVFASSQAASELWFAPAGFNRGGLSQGAGGIRVLGVSERLTSKDRDSLYEANINPIASFPSNGIVVFGQKTLQERQSALDRINVRRLVIYLKKQISRFANRILFDQNVEATWNRFKALVEPFLANTKARFGISEYRLILDDTTTTPDLIDQNILYAKIMIKPTRAIEFIAIDFVIASTGASFDD